jgi:hypothetical protein
MITARRGTSHRRRILDDQSLAEQHSLRYVIIEVEPDMHDLVGLIPKPEWRTSDGVNGLNEGRPFLVTGVSI